MKLGGNLRGCDGERFQSDDRRLEPAKEEDGMRVSLPASGIPVNSSRFI